MTNPNSEPTIINPVNRAMDSIEHYVSPVNSVYRIPNGQPGHSPEHTYQAMIQLVDGETWRAIKRVNQPGGGIVSSLYLFAENTPWSEGTRRLILDPYFNNLIDETLIVQDNGEMISKDCFRTGDPNYIHDLLSSMGFYDAKLIDKMPTDVAYSSPEEYQMYVLGNPDFRYVQGPSASQKKTLSRHVLNLFSKGN